MLIVYSCWPSTFIYFTSISIRIFSPTSFILQFSSHMTISWFKIRTSIGIYTLIPTIIFCSFHFFLPAHWFQAKIIGKGEYTCKFLRRITAYWFWIVETLLPISFAIFFKMHKFQYNWEYFVTYHLLHMKNFNILIGEDSVYLPFSFFVWFLLKS